jgi:hypothetical protein
MTVPQDSPSRPQHEVVPDPARLERAATLTNCGLGAPLSGRRALGGLAPRVKSVGTPWRPIGDRHARKRAVREGPIWFIRVGHLVRSAGGPLSIVRVSHTARSVTD